MQKLIEILGNLREDVDWANATDLIDGGVIDSFDIIALVSELSETFGVTIEMEHLEPENFNSVAAMRNLLISLGADV